MGKLALLAAVLLLAGTAHAGELTCRGDIVSIQGEGMVAREHRFEVSGIRGDDVAAVLEKSRKIARERQARAARRNPQGRFRDLSRVELECVRGSEKFQVRRTIRTAD